MVVFVWVIVFSRLMAQVSLEPIIKGKYRWISISLAGNNFASSGIKTSGQGSSANRPPIFFLFAKYRSHDILKKFVLFKGTVPWSISTCFASDNQNVKA